MERLKAVEQRFDKREYDKKQAAKEYEARVRAAAEARQQFISSVILPGVKKAEADLKTNGWSVAAPYLSSEVDRDLIVVAALHRKRWSVTLEFKWTGDHVLTMSGEWGTPGDVSGGRRPIQAQRWKVEINQNNTSIDEVKREVLEMVAKVTENSVKRSVG